MQSEFRCEENYLSSMTIHQVHLLKVKPLEEEITLDGENIYLIKLIGMVKKA